MHHIIAVEPKADFLLQLTFEDGEERVLDLKPYLRGSLFTPLRDESLFRKVEVSKEPRGLKWPNGADLCADMLYLESRPYKVVRRSKPLTAKASRILNKMNGSSVSLRKNEEPNK